MRKRELVFYVRTNPWVELALPDKAKEKKGWKLDA